MKSDSAAARGLRPHLLSFRDFVEQALFHPRWGYYATGAVRFGDGGHFDTYPLALSPYFGQMVAARAVALWRAQGRPKEFEICEIGAGNGQLCLDVLAALALSVKADWKALARVARYRIVEKSPALRQRQRAMLGPLARGVAWDALDLSRGRKPRRRGACGLVVANEVLDCLAHHKVVLGRDNKFRVAFVAASQRKGGKPLTPERMSRALERGHTLHFAEQLLPIETVPGLHAFLQRHYADIARRLEPSERPWTYYACPDTETFVTNVSAIYDDAEILLIDYGGDRDYHLHTPASARLSAGRPEERRGTLYRAPGHDDITFLVDFSVAMNAARAAGLKVTTFGRQGRLATLTRTELGAKAAARIVEHRALTWMLAVSGVGPEHRQRASALSWTRPKRRGGEETLAQEVRGTIDEFLGRKPSAFQLLLLRKRATRP